MFLTAIPFVLLVTFTSGVESLNCRCNATGMPATVEQYIDDAFRFNDEGGSLRFSKLVPCQTEEGFHPTCSINKESKDVRGYCLNATLNGGGEYRLCVDFFINGKPQSLLDQLTSPTIEKSYTTDKGNTWDFSFCNGGDFCNAGAASQPLISLIISVISLSLGFKLLS